MNLNKTDTARVISNACKEYKKSVVAAEKNRDKLGECGSTMSRAQYTTTHARMENHEDMAQQYIDLIKASSDNL